MGGTNTQTNLVSLTAREHFIAHRLLTKIYPTETKLWYAVWAMIAWKNNNNRVIKITGRVYESIRSRFAITVSQRKLGQHLSELTKKKMSASKKGIRHSSERREKIRIAATGRRHTPETCRKLSKSYILTSPDGTVYHVDHLKSFCTEHDIGTAYGDLINAATGLRERLGRNPLVRGWKCAHQLLISPASLPA